MSKLEIFEFKLPEFREPSDELIESMLLCLRKQDNVHGTEVQYETLNPHVKAFRTTTYWHTDGHERDGIVELASSSTPTEFASVVIEYNKTCKNFPESFLTDPGQSMYPFGADWVENSQNETLPLEDFGIVVKEFEIVQALPGIVASGQIKTLLHRSARHHPTQPTDRAFYRDFNFQ